MKRNLLLLTLLLLCAYQAFADVEPNNTIAAANNLAYNTNVTGKVGLCSATSDFDDYYKCALPTGIKSIRLRFQGNTTQAATTGSVYIYIYDKYGSELTYKHINLSNTVTIDSLDYTCFEADSFYIRVRDWANQNACKDYTIKYENTGLFSLKNDTEVNDDFATATQLDYNTDTTGHLASLRYIGGSTLVDHDDYYKCVLPTGTKSIRLKFSARTVQDGASGSVYFYIYDKNKSELTNKHFNLADTFRVDSLDYTCFEGDTFYVRVRNWSNASACKEYKFKYEDTYLFSLNNDTTFNDDFANATPLNYNTDTTGHLASLRYVSGTTNDNDDYYRCVLPTGTKSIRLKFSARTVQKGATGSVYFYIYDKYRSELTNKHFNLADTFRIDSLDYTCFEGDTFYVWVRNWSNASACKEYKFKYEDTYLYSLKNDTTFNDDFANATLLNYNTDTTGHLASLRYGTSTTNDNDDYYKCILPKGTKSIRLKFSGRTVQNGATGSVYFYIYNKHQSELTNKHFNLADTFRIDSLDYTCFEGDTFYVRVRNWSNASACKEYKFKYEDTYQFSLGNDTGANETFTEATPIDKNKEITGHLASMAYSAGSTFTDHDDYYICTLPKEFHGLYLTTAARTVQPGASGSVYYYIYNKNNQQLVAKHVTFDNNFTLDTIKLDCFVGDTFYVRVRNWSNSSACKEYKLSYTNSSLGVANAQFEKIRFGNSFSFTNTSSHSEKYLWTFGDGNTDTVAYPVHEYAIGQHIITLKVENSCGSNTATDTATVDGIEYYAPTKAGTEVGLGFFTFRVFGAGLDANTVVRLTKDGNTLTPFKKVSPSTKELNALFNLKDLSPGHYDVYIELASGQKYDYPKGLEIFVQDKEPNQIYTDIIAPSRVRTGSWTNYTVNVTNKKNRIANGVMLFIVVPKGVETNIKDILRKQTGKLTVKGADYNQLSIDRDAYNTVYYGGEFNPNVDIIEVDYDQIYSHFDEMLSYDIEKLYGEPLNGTVYPLYIPMINGNSTYTINFKMKTASNGSYDVTSYVWPFTMRDNPVSGETLDFVHDAGMNAALLAEMAPNPALKAVGKSAGYIDIGSQVVFAEMFDWYYGTNVADESFYGRQSLALAGELSGELSPYGKKYDAATDKINASKRQLKRRTENIESLEEIILNGTTSPTMAKRLREELDVLKKALDEAGDNLTDAQKEAAIAAAKQLLLKKGLNYSNDELKDLLFPDEIKKKRVNSVTSMDPNAIYGNSGYGDDRYIRNAENMNYLVTFENIDTAQAPAAIVKIDVQLDPAKYDITKTKLGNVTIAGNTYLIEQDRNEFFRDIDLRPANDIIVRLNAKADTTTGNIHWEFVSLDPTTMDVISDPDKGFLPPNKTMPEGEGSVSFTAELKQTLMNNDTISPFATIYFDVNKPILTNNWKNTIDKKEPSSGINPTITITQDSVMNLNLTGTDGESGFETYYLYIKQDDSSWSANPIVFNKFIEPKLYGTPGHTYSFYVEGKDFTGNREKKNIVAEATILIPVPKIEDTTGQEDSVAGLVIYPNPVTNEMVIDGVPENSEVEIYNSIGKSVRMFATVEGKNTIDMNGLAPGNYMVKVIEPDGKKTVIKIVKR